MQQRITEERTAGSINAYLRAVSVEDRAYALEQIGWSLTGRYDWKPAIRAYRASLALVEDQARRSAYDNLIAEHGFRIVDHVVESDAAAPRICLNFSDKLAETRGDLADFVSVEGGTNLAVEAGGQQICIDGVEHGRRYHVVVRAGLPADDGETLQRTVPLDFFVRDRAPSVRFLGNAYILPAGGEPTIPVVTINTNQRRSLALPHRRPPARQHHRRRQFPEPARRMGDRRDRVALGRESVDRHGRRLERDQPRDHDGDSRRRIGAKPRARRLHPLRQGGERHGGMGAPRRRNGSSSPTSASPRFPAMTACTPWCARSARPGRSPTSRCAWWRSTTRFSAKPTPMPRAMRISRPA